MRIVNLEQGSKEWLEWRSKGISATDIPTIMGVNPYKTAVELWEEKCGFRDPQPSNKYMEHGHKFEPIVRNHINSDCIPICVESVENNKFIASLDAYLPYTGHIWEIKCPYSKKSLDDVINKGIPTYWEYQVQWQCYVCNLPYATLVMYNHLEDKYFYYTIAADFHLFELMRSSALAFLDNISKVTPPKNQNSSILHLNDFYLDIMVEEAQIIKNRISDDCRALEELKKKILDYGDGNEFETKGCKVIKCSSPTSYDYKKMKEEGIDLQRYKKDTKEYFKVLFQD